MHTEEEGGDVEHRAIFMSNIIKIWRLSIYMLPEDLLSARSLAQQPLLLFLLSGSRGRWREQAEMNESNNPTVRRESESSGEGHDGVNTRAKACRFMDLFLLWHRGRGGGEKRG